MPYAIVETTNARGNKELSVVPDKWLRSSRNGSVVLWPNVKSAAEQHKLLRNEDSCPKKSWLKFKCAVKRTPITSYTEAQSLLDELSGESSSDVDLLTQRKKKQNTRDAAIFQKMLVPEKEADTPRKNEPAEENLRSESEESDEGAALKETPPPAPVVVETRGNTQDKFVRRVTASPLAPAIVLQGTPPPAPVAVETRGDIRDKFVRRVTAPPAPSVQGTLPPAPVVVEANGEVRDKFVHPVTTSPKSPPRSPSTAIKESSGAEIQTVGYITYETANEPNSEPYETAEVTQIEYLRQIIEMQLQLSNRLDRLETRVADIATQNEFILDALRKCSFGVGVVHVDEPQSFHFDPIKNEEDLQNFELKLADNDFKSQMVKWLRLNVAGDCADNRMLGALDLLFSKELQTQCTWTGASRKGPKIAIMANRNILQIFQQIGTDDSEIVTQPKLANFFKKKLKNSLKRMLATGARQGSRHVIKKKKQRKGDKRNSGDESDAACSTVNSSDAMDHVDHL